MYIYKKAAHKSFAIIAALLLTAATLCSCAAPANNGNQRIETEVREGAFISIDINPSIELVVGKDGKVRSVGAANADAEILLWQEEGLIGADVNTAIQRITVLAMEMGYITEDNSSISVTVTTDGGKTQEKMLESIDETIKETTRQAGIEANVEEAVDLVLSRELKRVKEANADKPGYDDTLTLSRYRLVKSAMRADRELTMDAAVLMTNEKLTEIVNTAQADAEAKFGEACDLARSEAAFIYENAKLTLLDSAYTMIYTARRNLSSLLGNHGASYAAYRLAYRTVEHYAETLARLIENPIFTSDDVFALANALGIDTSAEKEYDAFREAIKDENGEVTRDSVNAYINEQYKKLDEEDRARLEEAYDEVLELLDRLEAEAGIVKEDGLLTISGALLGLGMSVSIKTYEDLPALLDAIQQKIDATYARMDADLSENEKARVTELQQEMATKIEEYEKTYRETIAQAKAEAEAYLTAAKEAREK